jgi:hypothetical protein
MAVNPIAALIAKTATSVLRDRRHAATSSVTAIAVTSTPTVITSQ